MSPDWSTTSASLTARRRWRARRTRSPTPRQTFGVSRYMLAAIWGVEIELRHGDGRAAARAVALDARLLWASASAYFRSELMAALKILDRGDIPAAKLAGSWAGAFGQTQFMPSSYLRLAASGSDGDGGATSSIPPTTRSPRPRNYFVKSGWRSGVPWGFEVKLPPGYSGPSGRKAKQPMSAWAARGIMRVDGRPLGEGEAGLLLPAGADGPAFLVTRNFDVVYSYNAAESYSLAACVLADRLAGGAGIVTPWPTDDPGLSRVERRELQTLLDPARLRRRRSRTARSGTRRRRPSPTSRARSACRSTAGRR